MNTIPLPRSLDPLPDESLTGYLLRLAHRHGVSPMLLAKRCGLSTDHKRKGVPVSIITALAPEVAAEFAFATRLSEAEVNNLTLASLAGRYPFLDATFIRPRGPHHRTRAVSPRETWIFTRHTRYCPQCLRSDASAIQDRHGGAWSKLWRLPVVFACIAHQRLLEHACPACGELVHHRRSDQARPLPMAGSLVSHPAACRNPSAHNAALPCARQLDRTTNGTRRWIHHGDGFLQLQEELIDLISADPPAVTSLGQTTTAARYLVDLRIMAGLVQAGWPATRALVHSGHVKRLHRHIAGIRESVGAYTGTREAVALMRAYDTPPADSRTCAVLLAAAKQILSDPATARNLIREALPQSPASREWLKSFLRGDGYCSSAMFELAGVQSNAKHVMNKLGLSILPVKPAPRPVTFKPCHIPQYLPDYWYDKYFVGIVDVEPRWLRKAAPILLVRACAGGSIRRAGPLIGLPSNAGRHAIEVVTEQLRRSHEGQAQFDAALEALIGHLHNATNLIDYGCRRAALEHWALTPQLWQHMISDLVGLPVNGKTQPLTDWGDNKRLLATVWIWARITGSEPGFSPTLFPKRPGRRPGGEVSVFVHRKWQAIASSYGHFAHLRPVVDAFADQLARKIDKGGVGLNPV